MEMSHRIYFWYQISLKMLISGAENGKISFLVKNFLDRYKNKFCVENAEIAWKSC